MRERVEPVAVTPRWAETRPVEQGGAPRHVSTEVVQDLGGLLIVEVVDDAPHHVEIAIGGSCLEERLGFGPAAGEYARGPQPVLGSLEKDLSLQENALSPRYRFEDQRQGLPVSAADVADRRLPPDE